MNATLFVRPAEIVPALYEWPIYAVITSIALALAFGRVVEQLSPQSLAERPIATCVLGVLMAIVLSQLTGHSFWAARTSGLEFLKVVLYFLLLIAGLIPELVHHHDHIFFLRTKSELCF